VVNRYYNSSGSQGRPLVLILTCFIAGTTKECFIYFDNFLLGDNLP